MSVQPARIFNLSENAQGLKIGSLFSGYGGLDMGVQAAIGGDTAWFVEFDDAPSRILKHHWPDIPNLGDITKIDWANVPPVHILTGGFPCQDLSLAGRRKGMRLGTRSGLWSDFAKAIEALRPPLVVIENVRGLLSGCAESETDSELGSCPRCVDPDSGTKHAPNVRALGRVLLDLASLGYDARWCGVRAADAGAPHGRFRVFVVAKDTHVSAGGERGVAASGQTETGRSWADTRRRSGTPVGNADVKGLERRPLRGGGADQRPAGSDGLGVEWGNYEPAIRRWERVTGRVAPAPTNPDGKNNGHRLSSQFVEWMMGLPEGHVTDVGLTRNQQLKALGNGVVPQQAELAVRTLLEVS